MYEKFMRLYYRAVGPYKREEPVQIRDHKQLKEMITKCEIELRRLDTRVFEDPEELEVRGNIKRQELKKKHLKEFLSKGTIQIDDEWFSKSRRGQPGALRDDAPPA